MINKEILCIPLLFGENKFITEFKKNAFFLIRVHWQRTVVNFRLNVKGKSVIHSLLLNLRIMTLRN